MAQVGSWGHGLFGCFDDFGTCIIAYIVPCVTFGQTAEAIGEGSCVTCGLAYMVPILNLITWVGIRGKIREMKGIQGSAINDCLIIMCCPLCALVQEAQEVKGLAYMVPILNLITWVGIRGKIREMKGIQGSAINDCLIIMCCPLCALVQEAQEVKGGGPSAQSMSRA